MITHVPYDWSWLWRWLQRRPRQTIVYRPEAINARMKVAHAVLKRCK